MKSRKKREDTILLWLQLLQALRWPYVNSDGSLFGRAYETDIHALLQRQHRRARATGTYSHTSGRK